MAQAKGFTCDRPGCSTFTVGETLPLGWVTMRTCVEDKNANTTMEFCSNTCLALVAIERANEIDGNPMRLAKSNAGPRRGSSRFRSEESLEAARLNGQRTSHKVHHVGKGVVSPDCQFCIDETEPVTV